MPSKGSTSVRAQPLCPTRVRARRRMRLKRNYKFVRYEDAARAPPPAAPPPAAPEPALQTRLSLAGARPAPPGAQTGCARSRWRTGSRAQG